MLGEVTAPSSVLAHAYAIGAGVVQLGNDFFHEPVDAERWRWREVGTELLLPHPRLAAPVQRANAATAVAALRALPRVPPDEAFATGVAAAALPGRLQRFERDGVEIVVDVAHNPQAARELAAWLAAQPTGGATSAVFAALADKDAAAMVTALAGVVARWHLASLHGIARAQDAAALAARLAGTPAAGGSRDSDVAGALDRAVTQAGRGDRVLVFGSFHTAAAAIETLRSGR